MLMLLCACVSCGGITQKYTKIMQVKGKVRAEPDASSVSKAVPCGRRQTSTAGSKCLFPGHGSDWCVGRHEGKALHYFYCQSACQTPLLGRTRRMENRQVFCFFLCVCLKAVILFSQKCICLCPKLNIQG